METIDILWAALIGALGIVVALLAWIGSRAIAKVDTCVTREELKELFTDFKADNDRAHGQVTTKLDNLTERVDTVWQYLAQKVAK
jgi:hypothetical protein